MRIDRSLLSLLPWLVGAVSLGITGVLWRHEQTTTQRTLKADFDFSVRQTTGRVESRIADYEQMLRGLQGLFQAAGTPQRAQLEAYVDALAAGSAFSGVQYFAYAPRQVQPDGSVSARLAMVAPGAAPNLQVLGEDSLADPARRRAMLSAAESGGIGVTPQVPDLVHPEHSPRRGFLMVLPVYAQGRPVDSPAARRTALVGWVMAGIRLSDLMASLYGEGTPGIDVQVHDGLEPTDQTLMYGSNPRPRQAPRPLYEALEYIGFAGHTWTLTVSARPDFARRYGGDAAPVIAWSGLCFSLLAGLLTGQLVGARRRATDLATAMTSELRASEVRYRRIVETADEGIWLLDARQRTVFANPKLAQMLGYRADELLGRTPADLLDDGQSFELSPPPADGTPAAPHERRFRRRDGVVMWASLTTTLIIDADGRCEGALSMVTDITASKRADALRLALEAQLRESQKMQAVGTLAGGIAHDFNNVLAAILGNAAMARDRADTDATLAGHLAQIATAAGRARSLVQQILAFSRRQPHRLEALALRPVVEDAVLLLRPVLPALAELNLELTVAPLPILADATQLQQVVMNLCTNAWHALGGRAGRITLGLGPMTLGPEDARRLGLAAGEHARLWVGDTGSGMDEATRARVFEPFFTTKAVGQGTGLGLSVVHGIVATHGGAITVASAPGQGSRFDLYFPLIAQPAAGPSAVADPPTQPPNAGRHVVYVDDDPVMVTMVQALLQRAGYRVSVFEDSRQASAVLRAHPQAFDIVVTDYNMPGLSGLDLAAELSRQCPDLPLVISSGYVTDDLVAAAARCGVREVLQKEYTLERLPGIVQALLGNRAAVDA